ncbi:MAG: cytochrome c oxidase subunit 3 [Maribacter sp.]|nr:cytochrome c oxidase subunit 3 [Maribacter sp.]
MDLTQGTEEEKNERAKKMMLWFGIASLLMAFAGWTSAYIVSSTREDWIHEFSLPSSFYFSTLTILVSSITYIFAKKAVKENRIKIAANWLWATLVLGIAFILLQINGFSQMVALGYYFTGPTSNIKMSYIFLIAVVHIVHVLAGIISLIVVLHNENKGKYSPNDMLGLSLGATFWHFLDFLWVYLMIFMLLVK